MIPNHQKKNNQENEYNNIPQLEPIDLKELFFKILRYWYFIVVTVVAFLIVAFFVNRYSDRIFNTSISILIEDSKSGEDNILSELNLKSSGKNIHNEKYLLESYTQISNTLKDLDFNVSYYSQGNIKSQEIYHPSNFKIEFDSIHPQITNCLFSVDVIDNNTVYIDVSDLEKVKVVNIDKQKVAEGVKADFVSGEFKINKWITGNSFKFKIIYPENEPVNFKFRFNTIESLADYYFGAIKVGLNDDKSTLIKVSTSSHVPEKDRVLLNAFARTYIKSELNTKNYTADNTLDFIDSQLQQIKDSLLVTENSLQRFRSNNKVINIDLEGSTVYNKLISIETEIVKDKLKLKYYQQAYNSLSDNRNVDKLMALSSIGDPNPVLSSLSLNLSKLYAQKSKLSLLVSDENPEMIVVNDEISKTKYMMRDYISQVIVSTNKTINYNALELGKFDEQIKQLPKTELSFLTLNRSFELNEGLYKFLMQKRAEAGIKRAGNVPDNKIIDPARTDKSPLKPKTKLNYAIALLLGLVIPVSIILLIDYINNTVGSLSELEKLTTIPVLGIISHSEEESNLVVHNFPKSPISEMIRILRFDLQYFLTSKGTNECKTILVSSTGSGEGKTFTSINLATSLANGGKKVVLLGMDLRKQRLATHFGIENKIGISNYLVGHAKIAEIISNTVVDNLDIVVSGAIPPNPSELLMSKKLDDLMDTLKDIYDYIIIDTPPMAMVADGFVLTKYSDVNLFIIRQGYTNKNALEFINTKHKNGSIQNLSIIFNDFKGSSSYGYSYGNYYTYEKV